MLSRTGTATATGAPIVRWANVSPSTCRGRRRRVICLISAGDPQARFAYDGSSSRRKLLDPNGTIHYVGTYERNVGTGADTQEKITKYYRASFGRVQRLIAFRKNGVLTWVGTDHLGSTIRTADASFSPVDQQRYTPYGVSRDAGTALGTDHLFTSQVQDQSIGLYWYQSRAYDPVIGRFTQADTLVPDPGDPQALNRYSYCGNNPLGRVDPTGHSAEDGSGEDDVTAEDDDASATTMGPMDGGAPPRDEPPVDPGDSDPGTSGDTGDTGTGQAQQTGTTDPQASGCENGDGGGPCNNAAAAVDAPRPDLPAQNASTLTGDADRGYTAGAPSDSRVSPADFFTYQQQSYADGQAQLATQAAADAQRQQEGAAIVQAREDAARREYEPGSGIYQPPCTQFEAMRAEAGEVQGLRGAIVSASRGGVLGAVWGVANFAYNAYKALNCEDHQQWDA